MPRDRRRPALVLRHPGLRSVTGRAIGAPSAALGAVPPRRALQPDHDQLQAGSRSSTLSATSSRAARRGPVEDRQGVAGAPADVPIAGPLESVEIVDHDDRQDQADRSGGRRARRRGRSAPTCSGAADRSCCRRPRTSPGWPSSPAQQGGGQTIGRRLHQPAPASEHQTGPWTHEVVPAAHLAVPPPWSVARSSTAHRAGP
jgi:hypothetical protein